MSETGGESSGGAARVVIAGSGVGGLEAAFSLRALAADRVAITMVSPDTHFSYRPMGVRDPFSLAGAEEYPLDAIAADLAVELRRDRLASVQPSACTVRTTGGELIGYDHLLLAVGPLRSSVFAEALTLDDHRLGDQLAGLRADIERGEVESVAFIAPRGTTWPLPIYELAFLTAAHAEDLGIDLSITVATPEVAPLAVFGPEAAMAVRGMLHRAGISLRTGVRCQVPGDQQLVLEPRGAVMHVDRIVGMPLLWGPSIPGLPSAAGGFVPVDPLSRVQGCDRVFAVGDMTDLPLKHGGIAGQQADLAAEAIAADIAGIAEPRPRRLIAEAVLLGADRPVRLRAMLDPTGVATRCAVASEPRGLPRDKLITRRLTPYLRQLDQARARRFLQAVIEPHGEAQPVDPPAVHV